MNIYTETRNTTTHILTALDLHNPDRFYTAGVRAETTRSDDWLNTTDADSGHPAVAQILYATEEDGAIEEWMDADNAHYLLNTLVDSGDYDDDYGIQVNVSAYWMLYTRSYQAA